MKKGRPATKITVLSTIEQQSTLTQLLLQQSTTFGVRSYLADRQKLSRDFIEVETEWGIVKAKRGFSNDSVTKIVPEYEDCRRLAEANQVPLRTVYETVIQKIKLDENQSIDS